MVSECVLSPRRLRLNRSMVRSRVRAVNSCSVLCISIERCCCDDVSHRTTVCEVETTNQQQVLSILSLSQVKRALRERGRARTTDIGFAFQQNEIWLCCVSNNRLCEKPNLAAITQYVHVQQTRNWSSIAASVIPQEERQKKARQCCHHWGVCTVVAIVSCCFRA